MLGFLFKILLEVILNFVTENPYRLAGLLGITIIVVAVCLTVTINNKAYHGKAQYLRKGVKQYARKNTRGNNATRKRR